MKSSRILSGIVYADILEDDSAVSCVLTLLLIAVVKCMRICGATENAGVEYAIRSKIQGWKLQEWKNREQIIEVENAGVGKPISYT